MQPYSDRVADPRVRARCHWCDAVLVYCPMWAGCWKCPTCERHTHKFTGDGQRVELTGREGV